MDGLKPPYKGVAATIIGVSDRDDGQRVCVCDGRLIFAPRSVCVGGMFRGSRGNHVLYCVKRVDYTSDTSPPASPSDPTPDCCALDAPICRHSF